MAGTDSFLRGCRRFLLGAPTLVGIAAWIDLGIAGYISVHLAWAGMDCIPDFITDIFFVAVAVGSGFLGLWRSTGRRLRPGLDSALKASGMVHLALGGLSLFAGSQSDRTTLAAGLVLVAMGFSYLHPFANQRAWRLPTVMRRTQVDSMDEGQRTEPEPPRRSPLRIWLVTLLGLVGGYCLLGLLISQPIRSWPRVSLPAKADPARLESHVRAIADPARPRDWTHVENLDSIAGHVREAFEATGASVEEQAFEVEGRTYRNVIAHIGSGSGPRLVVGAHYDACMPLPGADDNASGIAGLLELARLLAQAHPEHPVDLVAYTLEEPPHFGGPNMGSSRHARWLRGRGIEVRAMVSLEMIGFFNDEPGSQHLPFGFGTGFYPSRGNFIAVIGRMADAGLTRKIKGAMSAATPLPVHSMNAPRFLPGIDFSDHRSYWDNGFPAVMVTDTAFYRNAAYHTRKDTAERLDYRRMAQVVEGLHAALLELGR